MKLPLIAGCLMMTILFSSFREFCLAQDSAFLKKYQKDTTLKITNQYWKVFKFLDSSYAFRNDGKKHRPVMAVNPQTFDSKKA